MIGEIIGTGAYVPPTILDNHDLEKLVDTQDQWIQERTGIQTRHIAKTETAAFMAARAAQAALAQADMEAQELDMILVSTISSDSVMPSAACRVQKEIGAVNAACIDLGAACCGFVMAYVTACAYIESGLCKNVLVVGSECLSNLMNWNDRGTCILFGDGAGAAVVTAAPGKNHAAVLHSDGGMGEALRLQSRHDHSPFSSDAPTYGEDAYFVQMDGQAVFKFAVRKVPQVIGEVLAANDMEQSDIKYYVLHQANKRIVETVAKRLKEPVSKFPMNLQAYGNTSSASIPILLHEMNEKAMLCPGDRIMLVGFGGGLTWGAAVVTWKR